MKADKINI